MVERSRFACAAGGPGGGWKRWLLLAVGLVTAAGAFPSCRRDAGRDPNALTILDRSFQPLRRDFEGARKKVRLVALMTPTCGQCRTALRGIMNVVLPGIDSRDLEIYCVWVSNVPPDVEVRARAVAEQNREPRLRHYWDDSGRIGRAFGRQAGMPEAECLYDIFYLYGRGDTWDPAGTMAGEADGWNALANGWLPAAPRSRFGDHPQIRMTTFEPVKVREALQRLLEAPATSP